MSVDLAERIALGIYGKTDRANSPENANPDFQAGYQTGSESPLRPMDLITREFNRRGQPCPVPASFLEWKRGMWAAKMQTAVARSLQEENA